MEKIKGLREKGRKLYQAQKYTNAAKCLQEAVTEATRVGYGPFSEVTAALCRDVSKAYLADGQYENAFEFCKRSLHSICQLPATKFNDNTVQSYKLLQQVYFKCTDIYPDTHSVHNDHKARAAVAAKCLTEVGEYDLALDYSSALIEQDPSMMQVYELKSYILRQKSYQEPDISRVLKILDEEIRMWKIAAVKVHEDRHEMIANHVTELQGIIMAVEGLCRRFSGSQSLEKESLEYVATIFSRLNEINFSGSAIRLLFRCGQAKPANAMDLGTSLQIQKQKLVNSACLQFIRWIERQEVVVLNELDLNKGIQILTSRLPYFSRIVHSLDWVQAHHLVGKMYHWGYQRDRAVDKFTKSLTYLNKALTDVPLITEEYYRKQYEYLAPYHMGLVYYDYNDNVQAAKSFEQAETAFQSMDICARNLCQADLGKIIKYHGLCYLSMDQDSAETSMRLYGKAIGMLDRALERFTEQNLREEVVEVNFFLGTAHHQCWSNRKAGDHFEKAVKYSQQGDYFMVQALSYLCTIYAIDCDKKNFHRCYDKVMTLCSKNVFPDAYVRSLLAYTEGMKPGLPNRTDGCILQDVIQRHHEAVLIAKEHDMIQEQAQASTNLADCYLRIPTGDPLENNRTARKLLEEAENIYSRIPSTPDYYLGTLYTIFGRYYSDLTSGIVDFKEASKYYKQALQFLDKASRPDDWADTCLNLGKLLRLKDTEGAISYYNQALEVYKLETLPYDWARTQMELGNLYADALTKDWKNNFILAKDHYTNAFKVFTQSALSHQWALLCMNLGALLAGEVGGADHDVPMSQCEKALEFLKAALLEFTPEYHPRYHAHCSARAARVCYQLKKPDDVIKHAEAALKASEIKRSEVQAGTRDFDQKERAISNINEAISCLIETYIKLDNLGKAIEVVRDTSTRGLMDGKEEVKLSLKFADMQAALAPTECVLVWHYSMAPTYASGVFVFSHDYVTMIPIDRATSLGIMQLAKPPLPKDDIPALEERISITGDIIEKTLSAVKQHIPENIDTIFTILHGAFEHIPFAALPSQPSLIEKYHGRVVRCPSLRFLFPAASQVVDRTNTLWAGDPGHLPLMIVHNPTKDLDYADREFESLTHFIPPAVSLGHSNATCSAVKSSFLTLLRKGPYIAHFSCHGVHSPFSRWESGLCLADGRLGPADLMQLDLSNCILCVLSACSSGKSDSISSLEAVGLLSALHAAGVSTVVASLWPVSDVATFLLMTKLYEVMSHKAKISTTTVSECLWRAQKWLQNLTLDDTTEFIESLENERNIRWLRGELKTMRASSDGTSWRGPPSSKVGQEGSDSTGEGASGSTREVIYPFASPFFWASFVTSSLLA